MRNVQVELTSRSECLACCGGRACDEPKTVLQVQRFWVPFVHVYSAKYQSCGHQIKNVNIVKSMRRMSNTNVDYVSSSGKPFADDLCSEEYDRRLLGFVPKHGLVAFAQDFAET